jgi:hypothetical protein
MAYLPNFKAIAEKIVSMGGHVHPVKTGEKALTVPNWQDSATRDLSVIAQWAKENPHYNCAVVGKPDGLWLFDCDDQEILDEYEMFEGAIQTYKVRSVSGGTHLYFRSNDASRQMGNIGGKDEFGRETWSARANNRYVISAGSVAHPNNDPTQPLVAYKAIDPKAAVIEAPDSFIKFLKEKQAETANRKSITVESGRVLEGGRNNYLTVKAGHLRAAGANSEEIESALSRINDEVCSPPLDSDEVHTISVSIGSKPYRDETVIIGNNPAGFIADKSAPNWRQHLRSVTELDEGDIKMLVNGFLPEGNTFIGGLPGEGKTLLALSIAKALTTGKNFLGRDNFTVPEIVPVLYLIPEVGGRAFRKRCEKFNIPDDSNLFLCRTISEGATLQLDDPIILEAVRTMKPVVFLDTVVRFNQSGDENSSAQNKALVDSIIGLRQIGARAVIGLHHSTKAMRKEGISLESVLRGTGDLAACCDAVYGLLRDDAVYQKGFGPNEIAVECAKARDYDAPTPFRVAASRRVDSTVIGIAPGIVSNIDEFGDLQVIGSEGSEKVVGEMLERMIKDDAAITINELAAASKLSSWVVRKSLNSRGWVKDSGGKKGASLWRLDLDAAAKKAVAKHGQPVSLTGIKVEMKDEDEVEDIIL